MKIKFGNKVRKLRRWSQWFDFKKRYFTGKTIYLKNKYRLLLLRQHVLRFFSFLFTDNATVTAFGKSVLINGSGNVTKCLEIIDFFLKSADDKWCHPKPCAIGRTYQPSVSGIVFYAIAAFQYAPKYLNAVNELGKLNLTLLQQNAEIYCKKVSVNLIPKSQSFGSYCAKGRSLLSFMRQNSYMYVRFTVFLEVHV